MGPIFHEKSKLWVWFSKLSGVFCGEIVRNRYFLGIDLLIFWEDIPLNMGMGLELPAHIPDQSNLSTPSAPGPWKNAGNVNYPSLLRVKRVSSHVVWQFRKCECVCMILSKYIFLFITPKLAYWIKGIFSGSNNMFLWYKNWEILTHNI